MLFRTKNGLKIFYEAMSFVVFFVDIFLSPVTLPLFIYFFSESLKSTLLDSPSRFLLSLKRTFRPIKTSYLSAK